MLVRRDCILESPHLARRCSALVPVGPQQALVIGGQEKSALRCASPVALSLHAAVPWNAQKVGLGPPGRWCVMGCVLGEQVVMFGGNCVTGHVDETFKTVVGSETWVKCNVVGETGPGPRACGVLCALDEKRAVLFGGMERQKGKTKCHSDMWMMTIDDDNVKWDAIQLSGNTPVMARDSHSMLFDQKRRQLVVFGGTGFPERSSLWPTLGEVSEYLLNDVVLINVETWTVRVIQSDRAPPPRQGHVAGLLDKYMVVCGGAGPSDSNQKVHNDVALFDLETNSWVPNVSWANDCGSAVGVAFAASCTVPGDPLLCDRHDAVWYVGGTDEANCFRPSPTAWALSIVRVSSLQQQCVTHIARNRDMFDLTDLPAIVLEKIKHEEARLRLEKVAPPDDSQRVPWERDAMFRGMVSFLTDLEGDDHRIAEFLADESAVEMAFFFRLGFVTHTAADRANTLRELKEAAEFALQNHRHLVGEDSEDDSQ